VVELKGVESIIGAYLALIIVVGTVAGLYVWNKYSTLYLKENIEDASSRFHYMLYPPIMTLSYSGNNSLLLTVYPRIPINIREIILKSINGGILYYKPLGVFTNSSYTIELPAINEPHYILLVSGDNIVYYYSPREDPSLNAVPDYVRSKDYVDPELIAFLSGNHNSTSNSAMVVLLTYGYKLHAGKVDSTLYSQPGFREFLFLTAPVDCNRVKNPTTTATYYDLPCNCNLSSTHYWITYGLYSRNSTTPYYSLTDPYFFAQNGSLLIIGRGLTGSPWSYNYFQAYVLLKFTGNSPVQINVTIKLRGYYIGSGGAILPLQLDFIPVVYYYDADTSPYNPVTLITGYWATNDYKLWLKRTLLEANYTTTTSTEYWVKTYSLIINPLEVGSTSLIVLLGVELINPSNRAGYIEFEVLVNG
jgi:hypothetical protein